MGIYISWTPNPGVMWVTPGGELTSQKWEDRLRLDTFSPSEMATVEQVSGLPWCLRCIPDQLRFDNYKLARPAVVWVLMRRRNRELPFEFVRDNGTVAVGFSRGELVSRRKRLDPVLTPAERETLDLEIAVARR